MKCIGFWKENLKSYLITYDELDALSNYRCWVGVNFLIAIIFSVNTPIVLIFFFESLQVYQRSDLNRLMMSQSIGPFCDIKQDITSWNVSEGAAVALELIEYERESKCIFALRAVSYLFIFNYLITSCSRFCRRPMPDELRWWIESMVQHRILRTNSRCRRCGQHLFGSFCYSSSISYFVRVNSVKVVGAMSWLIIVLVHSMCTHSTRSDYQFRLVLTKMRFFSKFFNRYT